MNAGSFDFACPRCRAPLELEPPDACRCPRDGARYPRIDGIWRFLTPERDAYFAQFIREYETVRAAEGRGSDDPAWYRALPRVARDDRFAADWAIRAAGYAALIKQVVAPREQASGIQRVLDLGAGNGWLAYRLSWRGHDVAAVDLLANARDGLGAHRQYDAPFFPVQAEFERLPLADAQADLAIFNSSLHYAACYETVLAEALRVTSPGGALVILDSPIYHDGASGAQMVAERQAQFRRAYGFASDAVPSENYLTYDRLRALGASLGVRWQLSRPARGWRWRMRPWMARLRGWREPAEFLLIVGTRI